MEIRTNTKSLAPGPCHLDVCSTRSSRHSQVHSAMTQVVTWQILNTPKEIHHTRKCHYFVARWQNTCAGIMTAFFYRRGKGFQEITWHIPNHPSFVGRPNYCPNSATNSRLQAGGRHRSMSLKYLSSAAAPKSQVSLRKCLEECQSPTDSIHRCGIPGSTFILTYILKHWNPQDIEWRVTIWYNNSTPGNLNKWNETMCPHKTWTWMPVNWWTDKAMVIT